MAQITAVTQNGDTYQVTLDTGEQISVPSATGNREYIAVEAWIAAGGVPTVIPPPPAPTPAQLRSDLYKIETDPMLLAIQGYDLELELATDQAAKDAINAKRGPLVIAWAAAKAAIRAEIPG